MGANVLGRLVDKIRGRQQEAVRGYSELVLSVADGNEPGASNVEEALDTSSKTLDDLQGDVAALLRRRELAATLAGAESIEEEQFSIAEQITACDRALDAAREKHFADVKPLKEQHRALSESLAAVKSAKRELATTAPPERKAVVVAIEAKLAARRDRANELRGNIKRAESEAAAARAAARESAELMTTRGVCPDVEYHSGRAKKADSMRAEFAAELAKVNAEIVEVEAAEKKAREQLLIP